MVGGGCVQVEKHMSAAGTTTKAALSDNSFAP